MSVLNRIAHLQGRRDEVPNQELARDLAATKNEAGIREIAGHLFDRDKNVQADCVKVLYEIGYLEPSLIGPFADDFLELLSSRNNRLVWGGMIALSTVAAIEPKTLFAKRDVIQSAIATGSVITVDNGIKTLAIIASQGDAFRKALFPYFLEHLRTCRPKDVPAHAESVVVAVNGGNRKELAEVLKERMTGMPVSRVARIKRVLKRLEQA